MMPISWSLDLQHLNSCETLIPQINMSPRVQISSLRGPCPCQPPQWTICHLTSVNSMILPAVLWFRMSFQQWHRQILKLALPRKCGGWLSSQDWRRGKAWKCLWMLLLNSLPIINSLVISKPFFSFSFPSPQPLRTLPKKATDSMPTHPIFLECQCPWAYTNAK